MAAEHASAATALAHIQAEFQRLADSMPSLHVDFLLYDSERHFDVAYGVAHQAAPDTEKGNYTLAKYGSLVKRAAVYLPLFSPAELNPRDPDDGQRVLSERDLTYRWCAWLFVLRNRGQLRQFGRTSSDETPAAPGIEKYRLDNAARASELAVEMMLSILATRTTASPPESDATRKENLLNRLDAANRLSLQIRTDPEWKPVQSFRWINIMDLRRSNQTDKLSIFDQILLSAYEERERLVSEGKFPPANGSGKPAQATEPQEAKATPPTAGKNSGGRPSKWDKLLELDRELTPPPGKPRDAYIVAKYNQRFANSKDWPPHANESQLRDARKYAKRKGAK